MADSRQDNKLVDDGGRISESASSGPRSLNPPLQEPYYSAGSGLGLASNSVRLVDYNPGWVGLYEHEKGRILDALGKHVLQIEHIGSTSIPGLPAKPIIDMVVGIKDLSQAVGLNAPLESLDYHHIVEIRIPGEVFYRKKDNAYHLHLTEYNSNYWRDFLRFRNHLRIYPEDAEQYLNLKTTLAALHADDRPAYTKGKAIFIQEMLDRIKED